MSSALRRSEPDTWLEQTIKGESWDYLESDTQSLTHNIHRYSGKFIPQIAARVIDTLSKPGELVLDPYCGSGTVLVEAALHGRRALGVDLNPLAVLIAQTKIRPVPSQLLSALKQSMTEVVHSLDDEASPSLFGNSRVRQPKSNRTNEDARLSDAWFCKWFQPDVLRDLVFIENAIQRLKDVRTKSIALVAFSDILRKSSQAHSGYPNVMFDRKAPPRNRPGKPFLKALDRVCAMIETLSSVSATWDQVNVERGTATALRLNDESVDLIVTHPPYIGSIPYAEYGALSLKWLGCDPKALDRDLTGGRRQARDVVERFEAAYGQMLTESHRVLRPGRYAFLMVGNPVVRANVVDLAAMTVRLANAAGFRLAARTERQAINRRANKMGGEHLLFFQKDGDLPSKGLRSVS